MKNRIIIDGYNLLHCGLPQINTAGDLETRRHSLIRLAEQYASRQGRQLTIVFDSREKHPAPFNGSRWVKIVFSPPAREADEVIRQMVRHSGNAASLLIVSSDREIRNAARDHGAQTITSEEFGQQLGNDAIDQAGNSRPPNQAKYGDRDLSSTEVDFWMKMFGAGDEDE